MRFSSGALAPALLSLLSITFAQEENEDCPFVPDWQPCIGVEERECATIYVPLNWRDPDSENIPLRLVRIPATEDYETASSIIINPGGPGGSGIESILDDTGYYQRVAGNNYHIVGFDPRGVGLNMPYQCQPPEGVSDGTYDFNDEENLEVVYNYFKTAAEKCENDYPFETSIIGTTFTARDVEAIARLVGVTDQDIRYWGFSYGTVLGDTIAKMFPTKIRRMVLDGNINPNDYYFQNPVEEASDIDAAVRNFFSLCADAPETDLNCAWSAPEGETRDFDTLLQKFDDWVGADPTAEDRGRTSTLTVQQSYDVRSTLFYILKDPSVWIKLAQIFEYWYTDPSEIEQLGTPEQVNDYEIPQEGTKRRRQDAGDQNFDPVVPEEVEWDKAIFGISCTDSQYRPDPLNGTVYGQHVDLYNERSLYAGDASIVNLFNCLPWVSRPQETFEDSDRFANINTIYPILYVQTQFDPVTPEISGMAASAAFPGSVILTSSGAGHCSSAHMSTPLDLAIGAYFQDGVFPDADDRQFSPDPLIANPFIVPPPDNTPVDDGETIAKKKRSLPSYAGMWKDESVPARRHKKRQAGEGELAALDTCESYTTSISATSTKSMSTSTSSQFTKSSTTSRATTTSKTTSTKTSTTTRSTSKSAIASASVTTTSTKSRSKTSTGHDESTSTTSTESRARTSTSRTHSEITTTTRYGPGTTTSSEYSAEATSKSDSTNSKFQTKTVSSITHAAGSETTQKPSSSLSDGHPKPTTWEEWTSQDGYVPCTKTVCGEGKKTSSCTTTVVALPTKTVYVDQIKDICETGITTRTVTVTATCSEGCDGKPTGIPQGYTTSKAYCSACTTPSEVLVTVKVTTVDSAKPTEGAEGHAPAGGSAKSSEWSDDAVLETSKPTSSSSGPATTAVDPVDHQVFSSGYSATATGPKVAQYTGGAIANTASTGVLVVVFAGFLVL